MTTISSGVNPYLTAYPSPQTAPVSGSTSASSTTSRSPTQSSVSVSLSASSLTLSTAFALVSTPVNTGTLSVAGNVLTISDATVGGLNANDVIRIYDGNKDITSKFARYQASPAPAGIPVSGAEATAGSLSTAGNTYAFNGKLASNLSYTITKAGMLESTRSNLVTTTLDTTPPLAPRAVQGTGAASRTITLTAPEANTTVEIWNGDPNNGGVQVYGGANDTFVKSGTDRYSAKNGVYNGTETLNLIVYLRDAAGNISLPSAAMTRPIDTLDRSAAANAAAFNAAKTAGTLSTYRPIDIVDTASAIANNIDALGEMVRNQNIYSGYVPTIKFNDSRPPIVLKLTTDQIANSADALNLLTSSTTPTIPFAIEASGAFSASQILSLPQSLVNKIKAVSVSMSAQEADTNLSALNTLLATETLKPGQVSKFKLDISDTVQEVQDHFDQIAQLKSINSIKLTDQFNNPTGKTIPLVLKAVQLKSTENASVTFNPITASTSPLTLTAGGLTLTVLAGQSLTANEVAAAFSGTAPSALKATVTGTLSGYTATRGAGASVTFASTVAGENVSDLMVGGTASRITNFKPTVGIAQGGVDLSIINKLPVNYVARVLEAKAKDALALQNNAHVVDFTVQDTVDQVLLNAKTLNTIPKSFTMSVKDTTANLAARTNNLGTVTKPYTLDITDATVDNVLQFGKQLKNVKTQFSIKDTLANVLAKSADLTAIKSNFSIADANNVISNDGISLVTTSGLTVSGVAWGDARAADASDQVKQIMINSPIDTIYKSDNPATFGHVNILKSISKVLKVNIQIDSNTTADQITMLNGISDVPGLDIAPASDIPASILSNNELNPANIVINGVPVSIQMPTDSATVASIINTAVDDYNAQIIAHNQTLMTPESLVDLHAEVQSGRVVLYSNTTSAIEVKDRSSIIPFTGLNLGVSGARISGVPMTGPSGAMKGLISIDSGLVATTTAKSNATVALNPGATTLAKVSFAALPSGMSVTLAGLTFKSNVDMTKEEVAQAFANIADGTASTLLTSTKGVFSGTMTGWSTGAATNEVVGYTATKAPTLIPVTLGREVSKNMAAICKAINDANIGVKATNDSTAAGGITLTSNDQTPISISNPIELESWLGLKMGTTSKVLQFDCTDAYVLPSLKTSMSSLRNFYTLNVIDTQANIDANRLALNEAGRNNVMITVKR